MWSIVWWWVAPVGLAVLAALVLKLAGRKKQPTDAESVENNRRFLSALAGQGRKAGRRPGS